ncbi:hypothetical protein [uncultured Vagococcus sp.]|uniref:hypothetical protein n=1 Tax=uncultured Vagococcus sp. TaxID=189676 RepID=UPI0028D5180F|nr:hypothetical protein [uncultured Vagococcus sp.]
MDIQGKQTGIPRFSFKSALVLLLASILGGILIPYLFYLLHWDTRIAVMLFLPLFISLAIAYGQCFIESKDGICKRFWITTICAFVILETLSYFWLFKGFIF